MATFRIEEKEDEIGRGEGIEMAVRAICQRIVEVGGRCPLPVLETKFQENRRTNLLLLAPAVGLGDIFQYGNIHLIVLHRGIAKGQILLQQLIQPIQEELGKRWCDG